MKYTPNEIMRGMSEKNRLLSSKNDEYPKLVEDRAQKEYAYNIAVAQKTMRLRANSEPVTIISTLVKGDTNVAKLKLDYDIACGVEKACLESMRDLRSAIDTYRSYLSWLKAEMTNQ